MHYIYWLISENYDKTYVGHTDNLSRRLAQHRKKLTKSTQSFGNFRVYMLAKTDSYQEARELEKYWKSCAGRKKLKRLFKDLSVPSSIG